MMEMINAVHAVGDFLFPCRRILLDCILTVSLTAFVLYGVDKYKAQHGKWRISEKALLLLAFFGGGLGAFLGMRVFHHKTKHLKFRILVPLFAVVQLAMIGIFAAVWYPLI